MVKAMCMSELMQRYFLERDIAQPDKDANAIVRPCVPTNDIGTMARRFCGCHLVDRVVIFVRTAGDETELLKCDCVPTLNGFVQFVELVGRELVREVVGSVAASTIRCSMMRWYRGYATFKGTDCCQESSSCQRCATPELRADREGPHASLTCI